LGKELLSSHLLLHIYSALEEDKVSTVTLPWQNNHSQINPSIAISMGCAEKTSEGKVNSQEMDYV
jgi:hypothetical protein